MRTDKDICNNHFGCLSFQKETDIFNRFLKSRRGIGSRKLPNQNPESRFWKNIKTFSKGIRYEQMHNCYVEQMHKCPRRRYKQINCLTDSQILISLLVNKGPNKDHEQVHQKANQFPLDTILKNEEQ